MATDWTFLKGLGQTFNAIKTNGKCAHAVFVQLNSFSFKKIVMAATASGHIGWLEFGSGSHGLERVSQSTQRRQQQRQQQQTITLSASSFLAAASPGPSSVPSSISFLSIS